MVYLLHSRSHLKALACSALAVLISLMPSLNVAQDSSAASTPISLAIIYDMSESVIGSGNRKRDAERAKSLFESLTRFVQQGHEQNEYFIIGFDTTPHILLGGVKDKDAALGVISKLALEPREGATALNDACYLGIDKVAHGQHPKRAVLVISDGEDTISKKPLADVQRLLVQTKVAAYTVNIGSLNVENVEQYRQGANVLAKMASVSGGAAFHPTKPAEMETVFRTLAEKLRN